MTPTMIIALVTFFAVASALMGLYAYAERRYRRWVLTKKLRNGAAEQPVKPRPEGPWHRITFRLGQLAIPKQEQERNTIGQLLVIAGYRGKQAVTWYFGVKVLLALALGLFYLALVV
jgi:hypothetical protein